MRQRFRRSHREQGKESLKSRRKSGKHREEAKASGNLRSERKH